MNHYELFFEYKTDSAIGLYGTYGIAAFLDGKLVRIIDDVSCDREKVKALTDSFNQHHLEIEHLSQAVEEFLYDFEV